MGAVRFILGALVVLFVAWRRGTSLTPVGREWRLLASLGVLFSVQVAFFNLGQDRTSAGHASVITASYPLWAAVLAHFVVAGDRLSARRMAGAIVAYLGVATVFYGSLGGADGVTVLGDALMLCSAVLLATRQIALSQLAQAIAVEKLLLAQAVLGTLSFAVASWAFETESFVWSPRFAVAIFYQGVLIAGVAFLVQAWLLKRFLPSRVTSIFITQPLFGVLAGWWILSESVGWELALGVVLVIGGAWMIQRRQRRG